MIAVSASEFEALETTSNDVSLVLYENTNMTGYGLGRSIAGGWVTVWNSNGYEAGHMRQRDDAEVIIPLSEFIDTAENREQVDQLLGNEADRTSSLRAGVLRYGNLADWFGWSHSIPDYRLVMDFNFEIEVDLPWYCFSSSWDGRIHYYLHLYESGGELKVSALGSSWHRESGGGVCRSKVSDELGESVPDGASTLEAEFAEEFSPLNTSLFDIEDAYLLPGDGIYDSYTEIENVRHEAALIVVAPTLANLIEAGN